MPHLLIEGMRYRIKTIDMTYPVLDREGFDTGEEETVEGNTYEASVVGYPEDREGFVEVYNHTKGITHLQHTQSIETAEPI